MLVLVTSIHVLNTAFIDEDVYGRDKPDHDVKVASWVPGSPLSGAPE